jgi:hypothetical protein
VPSDHARPRSGPLHATAPGSDSWPQGQPGLQARLTLRHGFQSQPQPYDPDDQGIIGSETQDAGSVVIKHDWSLSRKDIGL